MYTMSWALVSQGIRFGSQWILWCWLCRATRWIERAYMEDVSILLKNLYVGAASINIRYLHPLLKRSISLYQVVVCRCYGWRVSSLTIHYRRIPNFCDNTNTIAIFNNPMLHLRTKYIDIRYHFIRDHTIRGDIEHHFIATDGMLNIWHHF